MKFWGIHVSMATYLSGTPHMLVLLGIEEGGQPMKKFIAGKGKLRFKVRGVGMTKDLEACRNALIHGKGPVLIITREPNDPRSVLERLETHVCAG